MLWLTDGSLDSHIVKSHDRLKVATIASACVAMGLARHFCPSVVILLVFKLLEEIECVIAHIFVRLSVLLSDGLVLELIDLLFVDYLQDLLFQLLSILALLTNSEFASLVTVSTILRLG